MNLHKLIFVSMVLIKTIICDYVNKIQLEKIVGGENASFDQFAYQVSIREMFTKKHFCGGAIIGRRWIITAAHCLMITPSFFAMAGSPYLDKSNTRLDVSKSFGHPRFSMETVENDIGLIKTTLDIPIDSNPNVKAISLNLFGVPENSDIIGSGWGLTEYRGKTPNILQILKTRSLDYDSCIEKIGKAKYKVTQRNICTLTKVNEGFCLGDSGGPLVFNSRLAGVVSWAKPCARGSPDVGTLVHPYIPWIGWTIVTNLLL